MPESQPAPEPLYWSHRAEQELENAQRAKHPAAVKAHYLLAGYYLDRLYGPDSDANGTDSKG